MTATEWTAVGVVVTILSLVCVFLCDILRQHGRSIAGLNTCVITLSTRLTAVETIQVSCKQAVEARLQRGEKTFDRMDEQIEVLQGANEGLKAVTRQLNQTLKTLDDRIWQANAQVQANGRHDSSMEKP